MLNLRLDQQLASADLLLRNNLISCASTTCSILLRYVLSVQFD